jgi:hypothetical protein
MATGLDRLAEFLAEAEARETAFRRRPYYEPETDSLIFYIRDMSSYSKRITKYLTLFLANSDDTLVGIEVKSMKVICRAIETVR